MDISRNQFVLDFLGGSDKVQEVQLEAIRNTYRVDNLLDELDEERARDSALIREDE